MWVGIAVAALVAAAAVIEAPSLFRESAKTEGILYLALAAAGSFTLIGYTGKFYSFVFLRWVDIAFLPIGNWVAHLFGTGGAS
ncbi:hypothetical protein B1A99_17575 [Cohnella sp. CIP 111063]|jgi:hypothetical protein|uniref:hypothetical protein n=1 Tax=unclassified Cohnella TaxID=2636738 RepID=UPI000B8C6A2B|nr:MULTISPECIES: hypothetical protein [unclassified Cohnella]OXS57299.1 hypothetical protein B1A99_17575 [Cohnella sp. CIP 111063]PRX70739.1 hypothetical protein B0G52_111106 [Cohnella sp. SGD-V74]